MISKFAIFTQNLMNKYVNEFSESWNLSVEESYNLIQDKNMSDMLYPSDDLIWDQNNPIVNPFTYNYDEAY